MKKVLLTILVVAIAVGIAGIASAEKTKTKGKMVTAEGTTNFKVIKIDNGKYTTEKGKVVSVSDPNIDPSRGIRVETLKFKQYHNDKIGDADFVTMVHERGETIRRVSKDMKINPLKDAKAKKFKVYSTYNIVDNAWTINAAEAEELLGN